MIKLMWNMQRSVLNMQQYSGVYSNFHRNIYNGVFDDLAICKRY